MSLQTNQLYLGSCLDVLPRIESETVDLVYLDPPFYTQRVQSLRSRAGDEYSFDDRWDSREDYLSMIRAALVECRRVLAVHGTIFLHCDRTSSHHLRLLLDEIFGADHFQSEIIWSYKRWSNSRKGLMNAHQVIFFYSKGDNFCFNPIYVDYSPTTNVDQILQSRKRDTHGRSAYERDEQGNVVFGKEKKGVPLSDVWEIPFLNPKAKERTGYPTQKPLALLKRIIQLASREGGVVLDPFMGSGTTCVAAGLLGRRYIGIDSSRDAIVIAQARIDSPIESDSRVLKLGLSSFVQKTTQERALLSAVGAIPVQRNSGIDGYLQQHVEGRPVPVRIQREYESLDDAIRDLERATQKLDLRMRVVIQTNPLRALIPVETDVVIIPSPLYSLSTQLFSSDGESLALPHG